MIYISKGIVKERSTESLIRIHHCGRDYQLTGQEAAIWFDGRHGFCSVQESWATEHLYRMGLIEREQDDTPLARYWLLSRCICCPVEANAPLLTTRKQAKTVLIWLQNAGLRLSLAELIYLSEANIKPTEDLLHEQNRHALVMTIYTRTSILDNTLENQMEHARCRDSVVEAVLYLLKKNRLVLV